MNKLLLIPLALAGLVFAGLVILSLEDIEEEDDDYSWRGVRGGNDVVRFPGEAFLEPKPKLREQFGSAMGPI